MILQFFFQSSTLEEKQPQCGLCSQVFERQCDLGKHICSEAIKMFNEKSTKKSNKAITITDTIKDIMTKNSPVSSPLEIKSDENTSVTNLVTNNDTIMDVEEENTEILNSNQDGTDNDSEFRPEALKNCTVSSNIFLHIVFI